MDLNVRDTRLARSAEGPADRVLTPRVAYHMCKDPCVDHPCIVIGIPCEGWVYGVERRVRGMEEACIQP